MKMKVFMTVIKRIYLFEYYFGAETLAIDRLREI
jgi:hypothetical protein